jgi:hypothetical protein
MNKKKTVIFHLNNKNQYFGEFNENAKLWMIKSFFKDVSHVNKFKFLYNGEWCQHDDLTLRELTRGKQSYEILIIVYPYDEDELDNAEEFLKTHKEKQNEKSNKSFKLQTHNNINDNLLQENNSLKLKISNYEEVIRSLNSDNENLQLNNIELNNKLSNLQKCFENLSDCNMSLNKHIEQLKFEKHDLEAMYKNLRSKFENYRSSNLKKSQNITFSASNSHRKNTSELGMKSASLMQSSKIKGTFDSPFQNLSYIDENPSISPIPIRSASTSNKKSVKFNSKFNNDTNKHIIPINIPVENTSNNLEEKKVNPISDDPMAEIIQNAPKKMVFSSSAEFNSNRQPLTKKVLESMISIDK